MPTLLPRPGLRIHLIAPVIVLMISLVLEVYVRTSPRVEQWRIAMEQIHHVPVDYCRTLSCLQDVDCDKGRRPHPPKVDHLANLGAYDVDHNDVDIIAIRRFHRQMKQIISDDLYRQHDNETRYAMHRVNIALAFSKDFLLQNYTDDLIKSISRPEGNLHTWLSRNQNWLTWSQCVAANKERATRRDYVATKQRSIWSCARRQVQFWRLLDYLHFGMNHNFDFDHDIHAVGLAGLGDNVDHSNNDDEYKQNDDSHEINPEEKHDDEAEDGDMSDIYDEPDAWFYRNTDGQEDTLYQERVRNLVRRRATISKHRKSDIVAKKPSKTRTAMPMQFTEASGTVIACTPDVPVPLYPGLDHLDCEGAVNATVAFLDPIMSVLDEFRVVLVILVLIDVVRLLLSYCTQLIPQITALVLTHLEHICEWLEGGSIARRPAQLRYMPLDFEVVYVDSPAADTATFLRVFLLEPGQWLLSRLS